MSFFDINNVLIAKNKIHNKINNTPIIKSFFFSKLLNYNLYLKLESFQKTGSFKVRGVLNKLNYISDIEKNNGVISLSAGNHAQALAWASNEIGIKSKIIMPFNASKAKIKATKYYGGNVILTKKNMLEECMEIMKKENLTLIHPFDDDHVIYGQGTIGLEIFEYSKKFEYVIIGVGGGGLISGISAVLKTLNPKIKIIGVEPTNSNVISKSLISNKPESLSSNTTIADGLAAPFAGNITLNYIKKFVDKIVCVNETEIKNSLRQIIINDKIIIEPAAAVTIASLVYKKISIPKNSNVLCLMCGSNIDSKFLKEIL